jgi:hypothetical protein
MLVNNLEEDVACECPEHNVVFFLNYSAAPWYTCLLKAADPTGHLRKVAGALVEQQHSAGGNCSLFLFTTAKSTQFAC